MPIFKYPGYGKIAEDKAAHRQAELAVEVLSRDLGQEIRQARREYQTALINMKSAKGQAILAKESLDLAEVAYAAGAGTSLDVTDARRMYLQSEVNLATTELNTQLTLLTLFKRIGEKPMEMFRSSF